MTAASRLLAAILAMVPASLREAIVRAFGAMSAEESARLWQAEEAAAAAKRERLAATRAYLSAHRRAGVAQCERDAAKRAQVGAEAARDMAIASELRARDLMAREHAANCADAVRVADAEDRLVELEMADDADATLTVQRNRARASEEALRAGVEREMGKMEYNEETDGIRDGLQHVLDSVDAQGTFLVEELDALKEEVAKLDLAEADRDHWKERAVAAESSIEKHRQARDAAVANYNDARRELADAVTRREERTTGADKREAQRIELIDALAGCEATLAQVRYDLNRAIETMADNVASLHDAAARVVGAEKGRDEAVADAARLQDGLLVVRSCTAAADVHTVAIIDDVLSRCASPPSWLVKSAAVALAVLTKYPIDAACAWCDKPAGRDWYAKGRWVYEDLNSDAADDLLPLCAADYGFVDGSDIRARVLTAKQDAARTASATPVAAVEPDAYRKELNRLIEEGRGALDAANAVAVECAAGRHGGSGCHCGTVDPVNTFLTPGGVEPASWNIPQFKPGTMRGPTESAEGLLDDEDPDPAIVARIKAQMGDMDPTEFARRMNAIDPLGRLAKKSAVEPEGVDCDCRGACGCHYGEGSTMRELQCCIGGNTGCGHYDVAPEAAQ